MRTLANSPSSLWQCVKSCFVMSPQVLRTNWLNFALAVIIIFIAQYSVEWKNIWGGLVYILTVFVGWFVYSAFFYKAYHFAKGNVISDKETYGIVKQRYWRVVGAYVLFYFASVAVVALPTLLIIFLFSSVSKLFALLFIPVGLAYFWAVLCFFYIMPAIVYDNMKVIQAFKYSFNLVNGHWWRNFLVGFVYVGLIAIVLGILAGLSYGLVHLLRPADYTGALFISVISLVTPIFTTTYMVVQYNDLKQRLAVKI